MKKHNTYRFLWGYTLALLVLQAVVFRELHHLLEHNHEETAHCIRNGQESHIHSEEYAPEDCFVCFLHFAPAQPSFAEFPIQLPVYNFTKIYFYHQQPIVCCVKWHFNRRGPPAVPA